MTLMPLGTSLEYWAYDRIQRIVQKQRDERRVPEDLDQDYPTPSSVMRGIVHSYLREHDDMDPFAEARKRLIVALDVPYEAAIGKIRALKGRVGFYKVNSLYVEGGRRIVFGHIPQEDLSVGIFLDLKFHDIPKTVGNMVRAAVSLPWGSYNPLSMLTIHTAAGEDAMREAVKAARESNQKPPLLLGVTVLTSLDAPAASKVGLPSTAKGIRDLVLQRALLAQECGLDGVVCSGEEIELLKKNTHLKLVVPGIRPAGGGPGDQKRITTPKDAIKRGADYIVVGRPILDANDPAVAADDIVAEIAEAL